jgi:predicted amidohydrolase YtcJ
MKTESRISRQLYADMVIINGKVITVDKGFTIAQAVAVKDDKIVAVGTSDEIKALADKETEIIDLEGKTMLPGANEAHMHIGPFGVTKPPVSLNVGYPAVKSISDIAKMVSEKVKTIKPGEWVQGWGWDEGYLEECIKDPTRLPARWDLDPISPDNPVCLSAFSGHVCLVNSKAFQLAGVTKETSLPPGGGGEITRDPITGEPTGILKEKAAQGLVKRLLPSWTKEQKRGALLAAMKELNSLGITSATDAFIALGPGGAGFEGGITDSETLSVYNDLYNEGKLTVRINILLELGESGLESLRVLQEGLPFIGIHSGFGNEWLKIAGLKLHADGIPPAKTAWMYEGYVGGGNGSLVTPGDTDEERYNELVNMIVYGHNYGFQVGVHVCGDRAIDACVDGFIKALEERPWDARHYLIHGDFVTAECIKRMAKYNVGVAAQAAIKWTISDLMDNVVGEKRSAWQWPLKALLDAGIHVTNSSDAPVIYPNWKQGVESAVLRESKATGKVSGPDQCITREEAIRTYTIEGAWQDHQENIKGSIEAGKLADFCVLDEDIVTVDAHQIKDIPVLMTIAGGKIVYDAR